MSLFSNLKEKVAHYLEVNLRLLQLNFIKRTSNIMGYFIFLIIAMFCLFAMLLFMGFGLAEVFTYIANGSHIAGFFMTVGVYFLFILMLFGLRKRIIKIFASVFVAVLTESDDEDEEEEEKASKTDK